MTQVTCTICPNGCKISVDSENSFTVTGAGCQRGTEYAINETTNPTRILCSTVRIDHAIHRRCPVRTKSAIPKSLLFDAMRALDMVGLKAPVQEGDVIISDVCGTGVPLVATRDFSIEELCQ